MFFAGCIYIYIYSVYIIYKQFINIYSVYIIYKQFIHHASL